MKKKKIIVIFLFLLVIAVLAIVLINAISSKPELSEEYFDKYEKNTYYSSMLPENYEVIENVYSIFDNIFILGYPFFSSYKIKFDYDNNFIGFLGEEEPQAPMEGSEVLVFIYPQGSIVSVTHQEISQKVQSNF